MIIRTLTNTDVTEHNKTSSSAFIWGITEADNSLGEHLMYGAFTEEGTEMAQLECADFKVYFGNGILGCAGIGGVATRPEFRGKGCIKALFGRFENEAAEHNFDISILYPFSTSFYGKLGYANLGYKNSLLTGLSSFSGVKSNTSVILYEKQNPEKLYELYNSFARKTNLMFLRNDDRYFYNQPYTDNRYTYIWTKNGDYRACASFFVNRATSTLEVSEICYLDTEALCGIIGFLRVYEGNINNIFFEKLPVDSPLLDIINNTSHIERKLCDLGSARIHNITAVLEKHIYPEAHGSFSFYADDIIPSGRCIYDVEYCGGTACISKRTDGPFDISLDSRAMARIFLAGVSDDYYRLSMRPGIRIIKSNPDFLRAFPSRDVFFMNGF